MIDLNNINKIFITPGPSDLRMGIDGYATLVQTQFGVSPFDNSLYIFCNKNHNKLKILHFEHDGFWLYYKRIETGTIKWPKNNTITDIEKRQLIWLLEGLKIDQKALQKCNAKYVI